MQSWRWLMVLVIPLGLLLTPAWSQQPETPAPAVTASADPAVATVGRAYEEAFNKKDAAAVGKLWMPSGVHTDRATGVKTVGRDAIVKDLEESFKTIPGMRLTVESTSSRMITPGVAQVEGVATTVIPESDPVQTAYTTILVKQESGWLIDSVEESPVPQPETARAALEPLAWLVGDWQDQTEGVSTTSSFQWSTGGNFLVRRFKTQLGDEEETEGTQLIGWDPRARQIRSWTFNSDGSFGEATWSQNGATWLVRSTQTLADGGDAAGTYVITQVDDSSMTVGLVGHEVNGEPLPRVPSITVKRVANEQPAATTDTGANE